MNRLMLRFEGYYQMRMATDPDPTDEPRGVSGYTFALPGEPDFDRVLHLQPDEAGVVERDFGILKDGLPAPGPRVGVRVYEATLNGRAAARYVGAKVAFVGAELFELNGIVVRNDFFAIHPFRVQLVKPGAGKDTLLVDRTDLLDPDNPKATIMQARRKMLKRRQPAGFTMYSPEVAQATGLTDDPDPAVIEKACLRDRKSRRRRLARLLERLRAEAEADRARCAGLESRIEQLDRLRKWWDLTEGGKPVDRRAYTLALQAHGWNIDMRGPVEVNRIGADEKADWNINFWMGGWDGDALCAFIRGEWTIPLAS